MFANKQEKSCGLDSAGAEREPPGRPAPAKPQGPSHVGQEWEGAERGQRVAAEAASRAGAPVPSRTRCSSPRPVRRARSAPTSGAHFTRGCRPKVPRAVFRRAAGRPGLRLGVQWRLNRDGPGGCFPGVFSPGASPWKGALVGALAALLAVLAALALGFLRLRRRCQGTGAGQWGGEGRPAGPGPRATGRPLPGRGAGRGPGESGGRTLSLSPPVFPSEKLKKEAQKREGERGPGALHPPPEVPTRSAVNQRLWTP